MTELHLSSVYTPPKPPSERLALLYSLLQEREPHESISHKEMPTWTEHVAFVESRPYLAWYLMFWRRGDTNLNPGSIYLTREREVGIAVFRAYQGMGFGRAAFAELRRLHPGRILANVNPANERSIRFFKNHGARLIQHTYLLEEE